MSATWLAWTILGGSLAFSFFLSGMEAGVFALSPVRIRHWMRTGNRRAGLLYGLLQRPEAFFWTLLVGNTLANCVGVGLLVWLLHRSLAERPGWALALFALLVFAFYAVCDLLPKLLFRTFPNRLCLSLVGPYRLVHVLMRPLVGLLYGVSDLLVRWTGGPARLGGVMASRDELRLALQETNPAVTHEERAMIARVFDLNTLQVGRLATPLTKAVTITESTLMDEVLRLCRERRLTRLPVWQGTGADRRIAGVVSLKGLLYQADFDASRPAGAYLKPALYLEETVRVEEALRRMQRSGQRLAIVLGPGRRETGIVSLQDILNFILGGVNA